ncbi:D-inositol-3-phosphate glycosyltransferase [Modestobacter marinus]|uniref:D-inositol-3-phosphate glycosyltransferase n=1 Tax=Modestobacter marinus TaxID=477641 RepID=A0A846LGZ9_9ACTN|nr:D-inositol-3-phosphate glycosyltransferase [Modestobacter marinus]NIH67433.1 D-inositol-3-phosphate glycosyltransferase [Modestobacter marinus]GGL54829.1 D-inositol-3-phosphate glycosyltransferase [Modestobacter marinus]
MPARRSPRQPTPWRAGAVPEPAAPVLPRRVATLSVHTSPLEQPGAGDAGGMNVYVVEVSRRLADRGIAVDVFTRATSSEQPPVVEMSPGVTVRHVSAGPFEGLGKQELPAQMCAFTAAVLREEAQHEPGHFDVVHSHYWLSGQVGWLARDRWGVPLVHSAHTLAKVKNAALAEGDEPEPRTRVIGEEQVVAEADRLVANTAEEARQLVDFYDADPRRTLVVPPGVDLDCFRPGDRQAARARVGVAPDAVVLLFVGRIQPLKAPEMLLHAAARMLATDPALRDRLEVLVVGAPSGSGLAEPQRLQELAVSLGVADVVRFVPPQAPAQLADHYRAADVAVVPSHNESFGLVALEAQACGTPVVAAAVGGLPTAVDDGVSGLLVTGRDPEGYAAAIRRVLARRELLAAGARRHAAAFSWDRTTDSLVDAYAAAMSEMGRRRVRPAHRAAEAVRLLTGGNSVGGRARR